MDDPKIAVIVLNWNNPGDTIECLNSLQQIEYSNYEVIVADNGSTDDSVLRLRQSFPDIVLIENGENLGFAEGNNRAIDCALERGAELLFLLNNDTIVAPDVLSELAKAAERHPQAGFFGAKILYFDQPDIVWFAGGRWNPQHCIFEHIGIHGNEREHGLTDAVIDYVCGCALMVRAELIAKIGSMHAPFFFTYEETDWCYRGRKAGYESRLVAQAKVWHKVSASSGGEGSPLQSYFYTRNLLLWSKRNLPADEHKAVMKDMLYQLAKRCGTGKMAYLKLLSAVFSSRRRGRDPVFAAKVLGYRDYLLSRWGNAPAEVVRR